MKKTNPIEFKEELAILRDGVISFIPFSSDERIDLIKKHGKIPGTYGLDKDIKLAQKEAERFTKKRFYTDKIKNTRDWISYWELQKKISYTGLLIEDKFYITGDHYFYLNFIRIPNKQERKETFPWLLDTDIWTFCMLELAELTKKFTVMTKKRQIGYSLKLVAKILKRFWFEERFVGRLVAWDEKYVKENWGLASAYANHLNRFTAWKRPTTGEKMDWTQRIQLENGNYIGLHSRLQGITFKNNPGKVVSGKVDEIYCDEAGICPNCDEMLEFATPALSWGSEITGNIHIGGAVGKLKDCKPLKDFMLNPEKNNFLTMSNIFEDKMDEKIGLFIPEEWSYGGFIDEFGNSDIEGAKAKIKELAEKEKGKSFKAYQLYVSQRPSSLADAFASREENLFSTHIVKPYYDWLVKHYKNVTVDLFKGQIITHKLESKYPVITDFPVKKETNKNGAVVIDEMPVPNPPFGLYYAGVDTVSPLKTQSSVSVQTIYIYKAAHQVDGELSMDKVVAWYAGRRDDPYETYEVTANLIAFYNARACIENDNRNFIEWMIKEKYNRYVMKRSELPILTDLVPRTTIDRSEYGVRAGSGVKSPVIIYMWGLLEEYLTEEIGSRFNEKTGKHEIIYGVERIKDVMLLEEILNFTPKKNTDRVRAMCLALMAAKANTNRGMLIRKKDRKNGEKPLNLNRTLINSSFRKGKYNSLKLR